MVVPADEGARGVLKAVAASMLDGKVNLVSLAALAAGEPIPALVEAEKRLAEAEAGAAAERARYEIQLVELASQVEASRAPPDRLAVRAYPPSQPPVRRSGRARRRPLPEPAAIGQAVTALPAWRQALVLALIGKVSGNAG